MACGHSAAFRGLDIIRYKSATKKKKKISMMMYWEVFLFFPVVDVLLSAMMVRLIGASAFSRIVVFRSDWTSLRASWRAGACRNGLSFSFNDDEASVNDERLIK